MPTAYGVSRSTAICWCVLTLTSLPTVFEYLELGPVMRDIDGTPLEMELTRSYFYDVLQGLHYRIRLPYKCAPILWRAILTRTSSAFRHFAVHSRNVIHCDLKVLCSGQAPLVWVHLI
jgi:serine/threonine protein kinase